MSLSTKYNPTEAEVKWYKFWMEQKLFSSSVDTSKEPYTIVIPPPNVTGVLHMGHMLNNTIQDVLIRKARMEGKNACWVPGTDHASIATEAKVVGMLKEKGIEKKSLSRNEFLSHAWEWKEKYGGIILEQLKKLGASCDWDRTRFTMDADMSQAVTSVFVDLHKKGKIYRGIRMVNWDPQGKTALSDDEVIFKEVQSKLYYIQYQVEGTVEFLTIATTRPETIMADTAICINPNDARFAHLKGKKAIIPLVNRAIPIIEDEYVDMEFGTGCLKVTPAHDINDYEIGLRHQLPVIDIIADDGTLNEKAEILIGEDRFIARKKIAKLLKEAGRLVKEEEYRSNVGHSERTDAVIEPKLSLQWFLKMEDITQPALKSVMDDVIQLYPAKFKNMYRSWMENVRDWCISRQLWWGHQIPAFYLPNGEYMVANTKEEALAQANEKWGVNFFQLSDLTQDEDVLDTWFSSWLWPISVFDPAFFTTGKKNQDLQYYYPTNDLVTAPEILFFWVARMIIAGYEYMGEKPFRNVYLTGIVRDKLGRKMSKSLGNSPDPLELISVYGADGVRTGMLFSSPAGNDLPFDEKLVEQGRNFANKIWNAFRLIKGWEIDPALTGEDNKAAVRWFESRYNQSLVEIEDHFSKFRISDALMSTYKLVWDDFCSWYLEMIKPAYQQPIDQETYDKTIIFLENILKLLHPFMPFITEELWHEIKDRKVNEALIISKWPTPSSYDESIINGAQHIFEVVSQIRNIRASKGISPKEAFELTIHTMEADVYREFEAVFRKLANLSEVTFGSNVDNALSFVVKSDEFFIPMGDQLDVEKERENLQKELDYTRGFLASVSKKLSNERFVSNAPEAVVAAEKKKMADAEGKIKALEESLAKLG
jgi:valyl-tRNA synthetase